MFNASGESHDEDIIDACANLVYLQCWPHISRNITKRSFNSEAGEAHFKEWLTMMHVARTENHFDVMAAVGKELLCRVHGERETFEWFEESYLRAPYQGADALVDLSDLLI